MLVLHRRPGEAIMVGDDVEVKILGVEGDQVKIGVAAPRRIAIHRTEVYQAIQEANRAAAQATALPDPAMLRRLLQAHDA